MKKTLAAIVEYKLNKSNLLPLIQKILNRLDNKSAEFPAVFKSKMIELTREIQDIYDQAMPSPRKEEIVIDTLREMELLIVDYLSHS